jgi:hypothetical protein
MTYVLRLIPDIALKFEYALQLCTKLFDLETMMLGNQPQLNQNSTRTPPALTILTPRSEHNQQVRKVPRQPAKKTQKPSAFFSAEVTSASSVSSVTKLTNVNASPR